jgi:hypothetical protein
MRRFASLQELFADESRWGQGASFLAEDGTPIERHTIAEAVEIAERVCLIGGIHVVYSAQQRLHVLQKLHVTISGDPHLPSLSLWNDAPERTIADIQDVFRRANV